ncbi:hypothetical protein ACK8P5_17035 [Paenibacillus sp. EC2-1]|uniref:hypothetical protein n=1 Tax=Paenibacillus sp. EC2-1 TaxID=3388665 RepID=UPI003BEEB4DA
MTRSFIEKFIPIPFFFHLINPADRYGLPISNITEQAQVEPLANVVVFLGLNKRHIQLLRKIQ